MLLEIAENMASWAPVVRNNWFIKFSIHGGNILIIFYSRFTHQTILRHFTSEPEAVNFINFIIDKDPTKPVEI